MGKPPCKSPSDGHTHDRTGCCLQGLVP
jgi:hypothetical protein